MDPQQQQLTDRIKQAQNILVTVSSNPSVDQLSAAIGLTLVLNKLGKHGTAVFSGEVPSTLEFLKPEDTLEKNTDSLRDFIIALDKSKADKLRYKVEDQVVRIFITPYKTSISEKDLDFSQGDFNVDVVVALGVTEQQDLDAAITAHGRILHDATVASLSTAGQGSLGSINWVDPNASSLSEMVVSLAEGLDKKAMDGQIATALLTGIVASTDRFRNERTKPKTMSASAELMAAGANQQLIADELEPALEPAPVPPAEPEAPAENAGETQPDAEASQGAAPEEPAAEAPKPEPGMLEIDHEAAGGSGADSTPDDATPTDAEKPANTDTQPQIHVDDEGMLTTLQDGATPPTSSQTSAAQVPGPPEPDSSAVKRERVIEPPAVGGEALTANTQPEPDDPASDELTLPPTQEPLLQHNASVLPPSAPAPSAPFQPAPASWQPPAGSAEPDETLAEIEQAVDSPHLQTEAQGAPATQVDDARSAVEAALNSAAAPANPLEPITALNAQPLGPDLQHGNPVPSPMPSPPASVANPGFSESTPGNSPADQTLDMPLPPSSSASPSAFPGAPAQGTGQNPGGAPPVPPPFVPPLQ